MPAETVIQVRSDTAANWSSVNPTLASGELGFETDTNKFKIGNGSLAWNSLSYQGEGDAPKDAQFVTLATNSTLTNERVLTAGSGVSLTDGGAGGAVTVASFTAGGAARPLLTAGAYLDGTNGLVLGGIVSNWATVPDSAALSLTGDFDIKVKMTASDWNTGTQQMLVGKIGGATTRSYQFLIHTDGRLLLQTSNDGSAYQTNFSTVATDFEDNATKWVRVTLDADDGSGSRVAKFYTSDDGATWTQLGNTVTNANTANLFDSTTVLGIGGTAAGGIWFKGTFHRVIVQSAFDTADNTTSLVFDANFASQTADALAFTESSGNAATVTINTTRYTYGIPGVNFAGVTSGSRSANIDWFQPFFVNKAITTDMVMFEVTTAPASNSITYFAIYAADDNFNPVGAPIVNDSQSVPTGVTAVYRKQFTPTTLQPGAYVIVFNNSVQTSYRGLTAVPSGVLPAMGSSPLISAFTVSRTAGSYPSTPVVPNQFGFSNVSQIVTQLRWKAA